MRQYHVVAVNEKRGFKVYMTATPVPHKEGRTIMGKLFYHPARRIQLEEVSPK